MNVQIFDGATVRVDADNLVCITDIYKIAIERGLDGGKRNPSDWSLEAGSSFIDSLAENLNTRKTGIYKTKRGKGGGTYAHWQIALAYAQYLSHELHRHILNTYARSESGDVTLAAEIAEKQQDPKKTAWLAQRVKSIHARNVLTDTLTRHGVKSGVEIAQCTNTVYRQLFHKDAQELRAERNLPKKANLRDNMSHFELATTEFAELLASERIQRHEAKGIKDCNKHCGVAASIVANAVRDSLCS